MEFFEENVRFIVLHWVRCLALIGPLPIFGQGGDSRLARLGLGVTLGTLLSFTSDFEAFDDPGNSPFLAVMVIKEALLGFLLAFIAGICIATIRVAGHLIGEEMGFNIASIQDPITGVNSQLMAHLLESIGLCLFFISGSHQVLIRALTKSFQVYPVSQFTLDEDLIQAVILYSAGLFVSALQIAGPVFAVLFILAVALAIVARVAPQLQVMQFAFPVKILSGMILMTATIGIVVPSMNTVFEDLEIFLYEMMDH